jgi:hypothetical protein
MSVRTAGACCMGDEKLSCCDAVVLFVVRWWGSEGRWTVGRCQWRKVQIGSERAAADFTPADGAG